MARCIAALFYVTALVQAMAQIEPAAPRLVSFDEPTYPALARLAKIDGEVRLELLIDESGVPAQVTILSGHPLLAKHAQENVGTWRFSPSDVKTLVDNVFRFELFDGEPPSPPPFRIESANLVIVSAPLVAADGVLRSGCPESPAQPPDGPIQATDYVELSRSGCYGPCPNYVVKLRGDGRLSWHGRAFVDALRDRRANIAASKARDVLEMFRTARVWNSCDNYDRSVTDSATVSLQIRFGSRTKTISDYASSAPEWIQELQTTLDERLNTHRWRHGDPSEEPLWNLSGELYLPKPGVTELMRAAAAQDEPDVEDLLNKGAAVNAADSSGWTALMYSAGHRYGDTVALLLRAGADPNHRSRIGDTPLMAAAMVGWLDEELLQAGADINAQNDEGVSALMLLAVNGDREEIKHALKAGADPSLRDEEGRTAWDYVEQLNCFRNPIRGYRSFLTIESNICDAIDKSDYRKLRRLLRSAQ